VTSSRNFTAWLASQNVSLACTTYQTGKVLFFGRKPGEELAVFERTLNRCMDSGQDQTIWLSSLYQLWRFENVLAPANYMKGTIASTCRAPAMSPAISISTMWWSRMTAGRLRQHSL